MGTRIIAALKGYDGNGGRRQLIAAGLAGSLLVFLLFIFVIHLPLQRAAGEYRREAALAKQEINEVVNFQNAHLDRKAYQKELDMRQSQVVKAFPDHIAQADFLLEIQRLAGQAKLQLLQVEPGKIMQNDERQTLPVRIRMQGGYFGLLKFIRELQDGERFVTVQELGITAENNELVTDIMVNIYAVSAK